ncbi:hypothetical protein [Nocardiopsis sp. NPDC057823]|uniref:hypothetical protein n=1 Tax=Nocardiopsis sp. NPDC057823 TaxID=3346256 RepID=UPI00366D13F4
MATVTAVREALVRRLDRIPGLVVRPTFGLQPAPPVAMLVLGVPGGSASTPGVDYGSTFRGGNPMIFTLRVLVSAAHEESAVHQLDAYIDPVGERSVVAALEADSEPLVDEGGVMIADFVQVPALLFAGPMEWSGAPYFGGEWLVEVRAT